MSRRRNGRATGSTELVGQLVQHHGRMGKQSHCSETADMVWCSRERTCFEAPFCGLLFVYSLPTSGSLHAMYVCMMYVARYVRTQARQVGILENS